LDQTELLHTFRAGSRLDDSTLEKRLPSLRAGESTLEPSACHRTGGRHEGHRYVLTEEQRAQFKPQAIELEREKLRFTIR